MTIDAKALRARFVEALTRYEPHGVVKGGELLLPPAETLKLVDEIAALGIIVQAVWVWHYVDSNDHARGIVEDWDFAEGLEKEEFRRPDAIAHGAARARDFVENRLPPGTDLISLRFVVPSNWVTSLDWVRHQRDPGQ